jgi:hypothetical protein
MSDYTSRCESDYSRSYDQQYPGQQGEKDSYGNTTYTRYSQSYAGESSTGRDSYGNPTYG